MCPWLLSSVLLSSLPIAFVLAVIPFILDSLSLFPRVICLRRFVHRIGCWDVAVDVIAG
jgi:hypothetical protein